MSRTERIFTQDRRFSSFIRIAAVLALISLACDGTSAELEDLASQIEQKCPKAFAYMRQSARPETKPKDRAERAPSRPELRNSLLEMYKKDQTARSALLRSEARTEATNLNLANAKLVDAENLTALRKILEERGLPTAAEVGRDGVDALWTLIQHADADPALQSHAIELIKAQPQNAGIEQSQIALLTDRVLVARGQRQVYGSQFRDAGDYLTPYAMEDPAGVDQRRAASQLMPLADYACTIGVTYRKPIRLK